MLFCAFCFPSGPSPAAKENQLAVMTNPRNPAPIVLLVSAVVTMALFSNSGDSTDILDIVGESDILSASEGTASARPVGTIFGDGVVVASLFAVSKADAFFRAAYAATFARFSINSVFFLSNAILNSASCIKRSAVASSGGGSTGKDMSRSGFDSPSLSDSSDVSPRSTTSRFGCGGANVLRALLRKNVDEAKREGGTSTKSAAPGRREWTGTMIGAAELIWGDGIAGDSALLAVLCALAEVNAGPSESEVITSDITLVGITLAVGARCESVGVSISDASGVSPAAALSLSLRFAKSFAFSSFKLSFGSSGGGGSCAGAGGGGGCENDGDIDGNDDDIEGKKD